MPAITLEDIVDERSTTRRICILVLYKKRLRLGPAREFDAPSVLSELAEGSEPCPDRRSPAQRIYSGRERYCAPLTKIQALYGDLTATDFPEAN